MLLARAGVCDLDGYRRMDPELADALTKQVVQLDRTEIEADAELQAAAVKAIQGTIVSAAVAIAKTVAARPAF